MEYRILGPVEVRDGDSVLALGGSKPRAVIAMLLLQPNQPVSAERLAQGLWGEEAPRAATKTVQVHVSRLRKALGNGELITSTPAGYRLRVGQGELDAQRFQRLVEDGQRALADGHADRAGDLLREALELWRGDPLGGLVAEPFAPTEIARMEEQHLAAIELRLEADLAAGQHAAVVGELQQHAAAHPARERLAELLLLALYRCGRQVEALETYTRIRRFLVDEMGLEPSPPLRQLHEAILHQDASLMLTTLPRELDAAAAPPLVGREAELERLRRHWRRAYEGRGSRIAIAGEHGIGKSRLAAELAGEVHRQGCRVEYVQGDRASLEDATRPTLLVLDRPTRPVAPRADRTLVIALCQTADMSAFDDVVDLGPLARDAVGTIATSYAPVGADDAVPVDWLLQTSGGVPRRVHELSAQWARREAASRAGAAAGRAAAKRHELRSMEAEVVGRVEALQAAGADTAFEDPRDLVCPFKGLTPFTADDAQYFFGRRRLIAELIARLVGAPLLGIVGPSGSGKSSVLHAGLLPVLQAGVIPGSDSWHQVVIRPGEHPMHELTAADHGGGRVVLAIDQFEETFTVCRDEAERSAFIAALCADGDRKVILGLRADHYGRCAEYPELARRLAESHVLVGPMERSELREAIEGPAARAALVADPELVDALVDDVADEPGALPLLSSALLELWQHRDGRRLRYTRYLKTGGVQGAVARWAEEAYSSLDAAERPIARSLLLRLTAEADDGAVERRRVALDELDLERAGRVVDTLADRRLLTISAGTVEVAHEALLREWPRLRVWIEEDREGMRVQRELEISARRWSEHDRDEDTLYRGADLVTARARRAETGVVLTPLEHAFLDASEARERRERSASRRRRGLGVAAVTIVLVAAIGIALAVIFARRERDIAASRDLAVKATSLLAADPALGLAVALEAMRRHDTPQARSAVRQATLVHRGTGLVQAHDGYGIDATPSRDGRRVVTSGEDGSARVWDVDSGRSVSSSDGDGSDPVNAAAFSPDGRRLAIVTFGGIVALAPAATGVRRVVHRFSDEERARSVAFTPDGSRLVLATQGGAVGTIALGAEPTRFVELAAHEQRAVARLSADGTRVASAGEDGLTLVTDLDGAVPPVRLKGEVPLYDVDLSADGTRVVTAGDDGRLRVWDVGSSRVVAQVDVTDGPLMSSRLSPDGRVVVGDLNGVVRIVDMQAEQVVGTLVGHAGPAYDALFVHEGEDVMSLGEDGTLRTWTPATARAYPMDGTAAGLSTSPDGRHAVAGYVDGAVRVLDLEGGDLAALPRFSDTSEAYYSPDGAFIASTSYDGGVRLWDVAGRRGLPVRTDDVAKEAVGVDSTGAQLAIAAEGQDPVLQARDGNRKRPLRGHAGAITALVFSPDGRHVVSASEDKSVRVWSTADGRLEHELRGHDKAVYHADYSGDGRRIVSADTNGTVRTWTADGEPLGALYGHEGTVNTAALDRTGTRVVSAGIDGTVRVWDASGGPALATLHRFVGAALAAGFTADGDAVAMLGADGTVLRVPCEVCGSFSEVTHMASTRLARRLTPAERERLLPGSG